MAGDVLAVCERPLIAQFLDVIEQILPLGAVAAIGGPFGIAAVAPLGEVLLSDWLAME